MRMELKVYATNIFAMLFSFSSVDDVLKVVLLIVSILFTIQRISINAIEYREKRKNKLKNK